MTLRLAEIVGLLADAVHAELVGDPDTLIERLSPLEGAGPHDLSFLSNLKFRTKLAQSVAACVIVSPAAREAAMSRGACIVVEDPYYCFALITQMWKRKHAPLPEPSIHPSACIDPQAQLAPGIFIGAFTYIGAGAVIGEGARISTHCVIGSQAVVGAHSQLAARVTLAQGCRIGERCIIHPGAVIGADGFGFAPHDGQWIKIEQLGAVHIGNDVEIGANTCIDRGALEDTVLEDGVKIDNLVQIAHNVRIGRHTAIAGCAGVAGSAKIGAYCTLGGSANVLGHLVLADHVHISAGSMVMKSILKPGHYTGIFPIDDNAAWEKNAASLKQLHGLRERIRQAEKALSGSQAKI